MTLVLDCRGLLCPMPVIELARRIIDVPVGGHIELAADDPAARVDIEAWCRLRSQEYVGESLAADGVAIYEIHRLT